jgi:hypothetical protein
MNMSTPAQHARFACLCLGVFLFLPLLSCAQPAPHSLILFGTVVADSRVFLTPHSPALSDRNRTFDFGSTATASLAYRYQLSTTTLLQFRGEYIDLLDQSLDAVGTPFGQGFESLSLETSVMFQLPIGGHSFRMCIGGGGGVYAAARSYSVAGIDAETMRIIPAVDIHVLLSVEYFFVDSFSLRADVLFRDPQISAENAFPVDAVTANDITYPLKNEPFRSTINLNGNVYLLGFCWYF